MSIVKLKNKKSGTVYVYESESYWDKEKKQPRNKRKLIGKLDEEGNIVPTGKNGRGKKTSEDGGDQSDETRELAELRRRLEEAETRIKERELRIELLEKQRAVMKNDLIKILNNF